MMYPFRIGFGFDVHALAPGQEIHLGGITLPAELSAVGHSDADVLLHAICDALLGACGLRDIGHHFPNTDPAFKGIDSKILLQRVMDLVRQEGYELGNIDATLIAEAPKINPHIDAMKAAIATACGVSAGQIGLKATTSEKQGYIGRQEGLAAHAVALIYKT